MHGAKEHVDPDAQYFVACHPHGTVIFQRTFWRSSQLLRFFKHEIETMARARREIRRLLRAKFTSSSTR